MARGSSISKKALLEKQFRGYLAKHRESTGLDREAYEFNIKMYRIDVPDIVRRINSPDAIGDTIQEEQEERLKLFVEAMKDAHWWISDWGRVGRSGGWLALMTYDSILDHNQEISGSLKAAEKRLADLVNIEGILKEEKKKLQKDFADPAWWGYGDPQDWMPGQKPKMGGIFDFMKRKKPPEKQELLLTAPIDVVPSGGLIPAGAAADPFELLSPPPPARGVTFYSPREPQPLFDVLSPATPRAAAAPEPLWLPPPPAPAARPEPRPRAAWAFPTTDELVDHLRRILDLSRIFSQVRALRKSPDFRRNLDRWARQGLPALIPLVPVATSDQVEGFARFFGIPDQVLGPYARRSDEAIWSDLFWPLFDILSAAFEGEKPTDLPGWFALEHDPDTDEWWLVYLESE
jgi:hypothetical protein